MAVDATHPEYDRYLPKWKRCRDAIAGQDALHKAAKEYLAPLQDESPDDYKSRLKRSDFFNGTWRTIAALGGMAFRKPPTVEVPTAVESYLPDVNMAGVSLNALAMDTLDEVLGIGRVGLLVDHPPAPENITPLSVEAAERLGLRPTIQAYPAESIINWKFARVANSWALVMVVLKESAAVPKDEFEDEYEDRWRVLDLDPIGAYRQRVFRKDKHGKDEQIGGDIYPLMRGQALTYIPFALLGPDGRGDAIDEPPLIDLVDKNIAHYQVNSDYRHGLHFAALPTLFLSGMVAEDGGNTEFRIGSRSAITSPHPDAKGMYIEFTGQGLGPIEKALDRLEKQMAMLGARMIADETKQAETLGATQIKRQGENSVLSRIVQATSEAMEWALGVFAEWAGHKGKVIYQINRDFLPTGVDAQQLTALLAAVQAGEMSSESFFDFLQRGDVIRADATFEEERERIESAGLPRPVEDEEQAA
jgi:hypothetical protein